MADLMNMATTFGNRVTANLSNSFSHLTVQQWIRLVAIVGAYLLLRPYLIKLGARIQMKQHEKEEAASAEERANEAEMTPNDFRGHKVVIPEESDSEDDGDEGAQASAADWGKRARRRQRHMVKKILADHEKKLAEQQEDDEDKDIQEFLVD